MRLVPLAAEHREAVLRFETVNRTYFAGFIADRGDDFFTGYPARHATLLAMQADGTDRFHLLLTEPGDLTGAARPADAGDLTHPAGTARLAEPGDLTGPAGGGGSAGAAWHGEIAGRVNLTDIADGEAEVGYRIGEAFAGRGVATEAVRQICSLAASYGLRRLRAATSAENLASQKVLLRNGFTPVPGPAPDVHFARDLDAA